MLIPTLPTSIFIHITFYYENDPEMAEMGDNYIVYFTKMDSKWIIAKVKVEEIEACGYDDILSTVESKLTTFNAWLSAEGSANASNSTRAMGETAQPYVIDSTYHYFYNKSNAVAYAYTYTTSSYAGNGNDTSFLNSIFPDYTDNGGNCMNFASQCLWAGFKGNDSATAISNQEFPMHVSSNGWYYTSSGNRSSSWSGTLSFKSYVDGISTSSTAGMITSRYTISAGTNFSAVSASPALLFLLIPILTPQSLLPQAAPPTAILRFAKTLQCEKPFL